jgi:hypothetical protein
MNPIRRHAYVCAKCHEGANVSFAGYIIHEPPAGSLTTMKTFPVLFYAYWAMFLLLVGTLSFFIPHSLMVGLRELLGKREIRTFIVGLRGLFEKKAGTENEADDAH